MTGFFFTTGVATEIRKIDLVDSKNSFIFVF